MSARNVWLRRRPPALLFQVENLGVRILVLVSAESPLPLLGAHRRFDRLAHRILIVRLASGRSLMVWRAGEQRFDTGGEFFGPHRSSAVAAHAIVGQRIHVGASDFMDVAASQERHVVAGELYEGRLAHRLAPRGRGLATGGLPRGARGRASALPFQQLAGADVQHVAQRLQEARVKGLRAATVAHQSVGGGRADPSVAGLHDLVRREAAVIQQFGESETHQHNARKIPTGDNTASGNARLDIANGGTKLSVPLTEFGMAFSRRHYRAVSPRDDTPAEIAARFADNAVLAQVRVETNSRIAALGDSPTVEQMAGVLDWQRERIARLRREAGL